MAFCQHCGIEFRDGKFVGQHDPGCSMYQPRHMARSANTDKAGLFLGFWQALKPDGLIPEAEYRFHPALSLGWRVFRFSPGMLRKDPVRWIDMVSEAIRE